MSNHFYIDRKTGLLDVAHFIPSMNCHDRVEGEIELLVLHNISLPPGEFGGQYIQKFFTNCLAPSLHPYFNTIYTRKVSTHLLIERTGNITQFVPFTKCAWHAGISTFLGRDSCNEFSIGIELEGMDEIPYTQEQYESLQNCVLAIMKIYPKITIENIQGHSDIAPDRKTDPGPAFDWIRFRRELSYKLGLR